MITLSRSILRRILLELDVVSLVRCMRISKAWLRFISTDRVIWETKHRDYFARFAMSFESPPSATTESPQPHPKPSLEEVILPSIDKLQQELFRNLLYSTEGVYASDKLNLLLIPSKKKGQQTRGRFLLRWSLVDGCSRSTYCYAFLWCGHFHSVPESPALGYVGARYVAHSLLTFNVEYAGGDYAWFEHFRMQITSRNPTAMKPTSWTFTGRFEPLLVEVNDKRSIGAMKLVLEHLEGIPLEGDTVYQPEFQDQTPLFQQRFRRPGTRYSPYLSELKRAKSSETDELLNTSNRTVKWFFSKFSSLPSSLLLPRFEPYLIELYHLVESKREEPNEGCEGVELQNFNYFDLEGAILPVSWIHLLETGQRRSLSGFIEHNFDKLWSRTKKSHCEPSTTL